MISVIVPIYKVEEWLNACIDSVLEQDYRDVELILVDDGSPDRCGEICDAYAKQDDRIRVIHQENAGLSAARNAGTAVARGEYIAYVDSDDVLYPDCLSALFSTLEEYGADIAVTPFQPFYEELPERSETSAAPTVMTGEEACERLFFYHEVTMITAWGKLYRRAAVGDPVYPAGKLHEDEFVTYRMMANAGKVVMNGRPCYGYRLRSSGIMGSAWTPRRLDRLEALESAPDFLTQKGFDRASCYARKRYLLNIEISACQCGLKTEENRRIRKKLIADHREYLKQYRKQIFPVCTGMEKITIRIFCFSPCLYDMCAKLLLLIKKNKN